MNKKILELRDVITKLVPMLAGKGLTVTQRGSKAYVRVDPVTQRPISVNIPMIAETADDDFIRAIQGFIDHEIGHVLCTDFKYYGGGASVRELQDPKVRAFYQTHNILEDTMIEKEIVKIFPGSARNISDLRKHFIAKITKAALEKETDEEKRFRYLLVPMMRALAGHREFQDFMDEEKHWENKYCAELLKRLDKDYIKRLNTATTTKETLVLSRELHAILFPPPPPPAPPAPPPPPAPPEAKPDPKAESEEGESEDKPEKEAGEGDGDGERDHTADPENADAPDETDDDAEKPEDEADETEEEAGDDPADADGDADEPADADDDPDADKEEESDGDDPDGADAGEDPDDGDLEDLEHDDGEEDADTDEHDTSDHAPGDAGSDDDDPDEDEGEGENDETAGNSAGGAEGDDDGESDDGDEEDGDGPGGSAGKKELSDSGFDEHDEDDDDGKSGDPAGVGSEVSKSLFDFTDDAFEAADMSAAIANLLSKESIAMLSDRKEYVVYTREFDRIETVKVPENMDETWVRKMDEETMQLTGKMQKDIERIMASQSHVHYTPGHKNGKLHSPSLFRISQGDPRVFRQKQEHISKDTAVSLVVDNSGSMHGGKMKLAMIAAAALAATLDRVKISYEVIGFTTGGYGNMPRTVMDAMREDAASTGIKYQRAEPIMMPIYKGFDERMSPEIKRRFAYMMNAQVGLSGNIDGESVEYAAARLIPRMEKRKVMLVLSDGQPAGGSMDGPLLKKTVTEMGKKYGIECVGIGIMDDSVKHYYPNYVVLKDAKDLPNEVMSEIKRILS